ncbi:MAG: HEAT repeat protein [Gammaproteobacteria bacterium]|jgi:HEAT repeat protein
MVLQLQDRGGPSAPKMGPSGPSTPALGGADISAWTWWWTYNQDPYLDLKRRVVDGGRASGSDDFYIGQSVSQKRISLLPTPEVIQTRIGPAVLRAVREEGGLMRPEAALVTLGKLHPRFKPADATIMEILIEHLGSSRQSVVDSAIFAIGMSGDPSGARILLSIAEDNHQGRLLLNRERIGISVRSLAALSLGQLTTRVENVDVRRFIVHGLSRLLEGERLAAPDLHVACVTAMGFAALPEAPAARASDSDLSSSLLSREGQLRFLQGVLADSKRHEYVRAHVPKAMGDLAKDATPRHQEYALEALLDLLENERKSPRLVKYGLIEAIGVLADSDDEPLDQRARRALHGEVMEGQPVERGLALVALGLCSSRPGESAEGRLSSFGAERNYLMRYFIKGKSNTRAWAALALGLQGHHVLKAGGKLSVSTGQAVEATFEATRSPLRSGAQALALGLRREFESTEILIDHLKNESDENLRSQIAIALGLLGERSAIEPLESVMENSHHLPSLLRDSSIALAMLGHKGVVLDLVRILRDGPNHYTKSAAITALGFVGDSQAIEPLLEILENTDQQDLTRGFAATALGVICEEDPMPWKSKFSNHLNYQAMTFTMNNSDGTGVMNFR